MKIIVFYFFCTILPVAIYGQIGIKPDPTEGLYKLARKVRPDFYLGSTGVRLSSNDSVDHTVFYRNNFNIMTIGIYMHTTQREQGKYNLANVDRLVNFAFDNNIKVYFHPLIGGAEYCPAWMNNGNFSKEELEKIMRDRIKTILTRYGNKLQYVDVVNEPLSGSGMTKDGEFDWVKKVSEGEHFWLKTMGLYQGKKYKFAQYLVDAFRMAREYGGKDLKLVLNEYNNATTKSRRGDTFFNLIIAMREEGIPVDGAGMQMHCRIKEGKFYELLDNVEFDFDAFDAMLKKYEKAGIDIHITEFDIHLPANPTDNDFQLQGKYYAEVLKHAIKSPAVKTFKTWGYIDKYSYKPNGIDGHPLMLDENLKLKPAYFSQVEMLKSLFENKK
jgi:endo-1,4-beta-xylanase